MSESVYQVFYRFNTDQTANFTGLFGFMDTNYENELNAITILAKDECRAEANARRKLTEKYKNFMSGLGFPCSIEIDRAMFIGTCHHN